MSMMIGSSLYAAGHNDKVQGFLGLEVGVATVQGERLNDYNHQGDAVEYGVRLGALSDEWRATFTFDYFDSTRDDQNVEKSLFLLDYFFFESDSVIGVRPFIGANVGLINYESTGVDVNSFVYGGQAGILFRVDESVDLDVSYRYSLPRSEHVNNLGSIVFGFNYLY